MGNPWKEIALSDYENHMSLDSVGQLQAMNEMMRAQFSAFPAKTLMILGVAGGNGLEHIRPGTFVKIYGVDINQQYLNACRKRHQALEGTLELLCADLTAEEPLPHAELLVANLLVEYIGYGHFQQTVRRAGARYVSCGIQINTDNSFVSVSPYLHAFDRLDEVHHQMEDSALTAAMAEIGYQPVLRQEIALPNGKKLVRLDYSAAAPAEALS